MTENDKILLLKHAGINYGIKLGYYNQGNPNNPNNPDDPPDNPFDPDNPENNNVKKIDAVGNMTSILMNSGILYNAGANDQFQLGRGTVTYTSSQFPNVKTYRCVSINPLGWANEATVTVYLESYSKNHENMAMVSLYNFADISGNCAIRNNSELWTCGNADFANRNGISVHLGSLYNPSLPSINTFLKNWIIGELAADRDYLTKIQKYYTQTVNKINYQICKSLFINSLCQFKTGKIFAIFDHSKLANISPLSRKNRLFFDFYVSVIYSLSIIIILVEFYRF